MTKHKKIFFSIFLFFFIFIFSGCCKSEEYQKKLKIGDSLINVSLYVSNKNKAHNTFKEIENIYKKYINGNINTNEISKFQNRFQNYHKYIDNSYNSEFYIHGIANNKVHKYLKENGINKFKIISSKFVLVGSPYDKEYYNIAIASPTDNSILKMLKVKNKYVVTKNINNDIYKNNIFHNESNNLSVTVVTDNIKNADYLASLLLMMPIKEGKMIAKKYHLDVIWYYGYQSDYKIDMTDGINAY